MRGYLSIFFHRSRALYQYKAAACAGLATQLFWGIIRLMIFTAFYAQAASSQPLTLAQTITFIWVSQALLRLIPWDIDKEIEEQIRTGDYIYELVRPLHLYGLWFARSLSLRLVPVFLRGILVLCVAWLCFGLEAPHSMVSGVLFIISSLFAVLLSASLTTCVTITLLWTVCGEGIKRLMPSISLIFSGIVIPLPLFPVWTHFVMDIQPLRGLIDIPCRIYTGVIPESDAYVYLGFQVCWTLICIGIGTWLLRHAMKRVVIQGG